MAEITRSIRHRIKIERGLTGKVGWECSVESEIIGDGTVDEEQSQADTLRLSDALVAALKARYEAPEAKT